MKFVKCSQDKMHWGDGRSKKEVECINPPINLELVKYLGKGNLTARTYWDEIIFPRIRFFFVDGTHQNWTYESEEARDEDYEKLLR